MKQKITNYIRAGYPGLYIVSSEETRVEAVTKEIAQSFERRLFAWSISDGMIDTADGQAHKADDPLLVAPLIHDLPDDSLFLLRDFHLFLEDVNPLLMRDLKTLLGVCKTKGKVIIIVGCRLVLPPELEREFVIISFALPDKEQLGVVLDNVAQSAKTTPPDGEQRNALLDSACGLTSIEAENAFALSVVEAGHLAPAVVAREKANEVKKGGLLEVCSNVASLDEVGGLEELKAWLQQRKNAFGPEAKAFGLPTPKGLLIIGIPGTGKSLTAKATAGVFGLPLLKLDAGKLFAGVVGQSESNLRSVIATVEAIAPCVLWLDEIEKGFNGSKSSGFSDGGTASRVFGTFLSWMQDRKSPVFVVATANDVTQLPPEFLRKGRFDELFFVDLPSQEERESIWRIQIEKYGRKSDTFDVVQLGRAATGFTGSEIEQVFVDALYDAFSQKKEPTDLSIAMVLTDAVPLSKLMGDQIDALRKWAKGRARLATKAAKDGKAGRKILLQD